MGNNFIKNKNLILILLVLLSAGIVVVLRNISVHAADTFLIEPADSELTSSQAQRITDRKTAFKDQLSQASLAGLATKCQKAQTVVAKVKGRDGSALEARRNFYAATDDKLKYIIDNAKAKGINTDAISSARQAFILAVNQYFLDANTYKADIDDLAQMNCTSDTAGFKATLLSTRIDRAKLVTDTKAIVATYPKLKTAAADIKKATK